MFSTVLLLAFTLGDAHGALYAGVWRSGSDGYYLWSNVNWQDFMAKSNELNDQNLGLVDVNIYPQTASPTPSPTPSPEDEPSQPFDPGDYCDHAGICD